MKLYYLGEGEAAEFHIGSQVYKITKSGDEIPDGVAKELMGKYPLSLSDNLSTSGGGE